jgi:hypothetical protein
MPLICYTTVVGALTEALLHLKEHNLFLLISLMIIYFITQGDYELQLTFLVFLYLILHLVELMYHSSFKKLMYNKIFRSKFLKCSIASYNSLLYEITNITWYIVDLCDYERRLPDRFPKGCHILLVDPMLATGISFSVSITANCYIGLLLFLYSSDWFSPVSMTRLRW